MARLRIVHPMQVEAILKTILLQSIQLRYTAFRVTRKCSAAMENQGTGTLCQNAILVLTHPSILRAVSPLEGEVRS